MSKPLEVTEEFFVNQIESGVVVFIEHAADGTQVCTAVFRRELMQQMLDAVGAAKLNRIHLKSDIPQEEGSTNE